ncbi:hypothetical protein BAUCODRAFT_32924 [Baudoinia panamericana UAMH 10762]|uniref:Cytochrome P450 n=1 Tax=Baudoinia panamericana (strain UAMH 10762) TaxID=717646 RepID=M2MZW5_BAUPA|nr:uncharacterized protein BAUCODRAFT_32924 [Baudoinia panamericana UAMH 10762]EMC97183.1 hypothetical protein BAUCODRAFT_32924 [Baudoinia panamericana UAMH 10762]
MDAEFRKMAITQIRTFIFAGHDTTSTAIAYAFYLLHKHQDCLERIRAEHDAVLGPIDQTPQVIKNDPYILNKLEYTMAVIKETLRLFPPVSATRKGAPGLMIRDPQSGEAYPAPPDFLVWVIHYAQHRNPKVWGDSADLFMPARFLPENESKLPETAWRPFERGPRNCIGQELAMLESRIVLALVCRSFDFQPAFDALDELKDDGTVWAKDESFRKGKQDLDGEEAYPVFVGTAKPREGMPCRVLKAQ